MGSWINSVSLWIASTAWHTHHMARTDNGLDKDLRDWIAAQHLFFVATAPTTGRVNVSPKGMDTFRVLTPTRVAYLDATGSGSETSAHLLENGRITLAGSGAALLSRRLGDGFAGRLLNRCCEGHAGASYPGTSVHYHHTALPGRLQAQLSPAGQR